MDYMDCVDQDKSAQNADIWSILLRYAEILVGKKS